MLAQLGAEGIQLGITPLEMVQGQPCVLAEREDILQGGPVFAFQGLQEIEPLFHLREAFGIEIDAVDVTMEFLLEILEEAGDLGLQLRKEAGGAVELVEFLQRASKGAVLREEVGFGIADLGQRRLAQFGEACGIGGALMIGLERVVLFGLHLRAFDLQDLVAQEIELPRIGGFVDDQILLPGEELTVAGDTGFELLAGVLQVAVGVEDVQLTGGTKKGLMVVRAVEVDEPEADFGKGLERGWGAIDKLAVGPGACEGAFQEKLSGFAGFDTALGEQSVEFGCELTPVELAFDQAQLLPGPDQVAVGALAQEEAESADEDGLARAGFAGNGDKARRELEGEIIDEGEILDAQADEHGVVGT